MLLYFLYSYSTRLETGENVETNMSCESLSRVCMYCCRLFCWQACWLCVYAPLQLYMSERIQLQLCASHPSMCSVQKMTLYCVCHVSGKTKCVIDSWTSCFSWQLCVSDCGNISWNVHPQLSSHLLCPLRVVPDQQGYYRAVLVWCSSEGIPQPPISLPLSPLPSALPRALEGNVCSYHCVLHVHRQCISPGYSFSSSSFSEHSELVVEYTTHTTNVPPCPSCYTVEPNLH